MATYKGEVVAGKVALNSVRKASYRYVPIGNGFEGLTLTTRGRGPGGHSVLRTWEQDASYYTDANILDEYGPRGYIEFKDTENSDQWEEMACVRPERGRKGKSASDVPVAAHQHISGVKNTLKHDTPSVADVASDLAENVYVGAYLTAEGVLETTLSHRKHAYTIAFKEFVRQQTHRLELKNLNGLKYQGGNILNTELVTRALTWEIRDLGAFARAVYPQGNKTGLEAILEGANTLAKLWEFLLGRDVVLIMGTGVYRSVISEYLRGLVIKIDELKEYVPTEIEEASIKFVNTMIDHDMAAFKTALSTRAAELPTATLNGLATVSGSDRNEAWKVHQVGRAEASRNYHERQKMIALEVDKRTAALRSQIEQIRNTRRGREKESGRTTDDPPDKKAKIERKGKGTAEMLKSYLGKGVPDKLPAPPTMPGKWRVKDPNAANGTWNNKFVDKGFLFTGRAEHTDNNHVKCILTNKAMNKIWGYKGKDNQAAYDAYWKVRAYLVHHDGSLIDSGVSNVAQEE